MPNIPTYTSEQPVAQANNMAEAAFLHQRENAGRIGGAISDLADTGFGVVRKIEENRALEESANLAGDLATKGAEIDEKIRQAKANADPYSENFADWATTTKQTVVDPIVETLGQNATTREGQRQAAVLRAKLGGMYYTKLNVDQAEITGAAAADSIRTMGNQIVKDVSDDPSTFEIGIGKIDLLIDGLIQTGFPRAQADELKRSLFAGTAVSALEASAEISPTKAQKDLDAGRYAKYLPEEKQAQVQGYIERQRLVVAERAKQAHDAIEQAHREASEAAYSEGAVAIQNNPAKADLGKILNARGPDGRLLLSGEHINSLIRLRNEEVDRQKKGSIGDEENKGSGFWDTYQKVVSGQITDPTTIYNMAGVGKPLTLAGANALFEVAKKVKEGPNKGDFETQKLAKFDALIHRQIIAPDGIVLGYEERNIAERNYTRAWFDSRKAIEEGKRKGLSLDEMLDDRSPNYIMKNLQAYVPAQEALRYPGTNPGEKFDLKTLDTQFKDGREGMASGLKALQDAVAAGRIAREQAIGYALKRGWGIVKKPTVVTPPAQPGVPIARAEGGMIKAGVPYMVGERGPETIIPTHNGIVIPYDESTLNLGRATKELKLTPQEQYLYYHGIRNMKEGKTVTQPDGSVSSILQMVVDGPNGKIYNIPSVWDGKALSETEAKKRAAAVGWDKWPSYSSYKEADRRYIEDMHPYMDDDVQKMLTAMHAGKK